MAKTKTALIAEFIEQNPNATGKEAAAALGKHGISAQYFYTIKSNLAKRDGKPTGGRKKKKKKVGGGKQVVRRKITASASDLSVEDLQSAATFAADFGGLDKLGAAVNALRQFQVSGN